jgi:transketolase
LLHFFPRFPLISPCFALQNVPNLKGSSAENVRHGAYTLRENFEAGQHPQLVLVATGSEVSLAIDSLESLKDVRVRVVSMPSWELFREQPLEYRLRVLPDGVPVLAVEAASAIGWREFAHAVVGMTTFGASAPYKKVFEKFGFTTSHVSEKARVVIEYYSKIPGGAQSVIRRPF